MKINLLDSGKRYNRNWIFKNFTYSFISGKRYAILGPNGSGKSTLIKVISGYLMQSEGRVEYIQNDEQIPIEKTYQYISFTAPYIELLEEFTVKEQIDFHLKFRKLAFNYTTEDVLDLLKFRDHSNKMLKNLSSGMRQRLKLALTILSDVPVLLLDEPATNLDAQGVEWYRDLIEKYSSDKIVIVASNRADEYDFCEEKINIVNYKKVTVMP